MLQKYCRQWRIKDLAHPEMSERYEVPPGDEMQSAQFDGIESAFQYFNGIPIAVVSDNTRCLVDGRGENGQTLFNRRYLQLSRYWQFVPVNCKP